jgi:hypothetical protein
VLKAERNDQIQVRIERRSEERGRQHGIGTRKMRDRSAESMQLMHDSSDAISMRQSFERLQVSRPTSNRRSRGRQHRGQPC